MAQPRSDATPPAGAAAGAPAGPPAGPSAAPGPPRSRAGRAFAVALSLYGAVIFTVLWFGFAIGLATGGDLPVDAWAWLTGLEPVAAVVAWVLFLPIAVGLWAWNAAGSVLVIAIVGIGLVAWTLLMLNGLAKTFGRRAGG